MEFREFKAEILSKIKEKVSAALENKKIEIAQKMFGEGIDEANSKWEYLDGRGVKQTGELVKTIERQGTDVTYAFKNSKTGEVDLVSGSKLKSAKKLKEETGLDEGRVKVTKEAVTKLLVKWGSNPKDAEKMVDSEFDSAIKAYPEATAKHIADVVRTTSESFELEEENKAEKAAKEVLKQFKGKMPKSASDLNDFDDAVEKAAKKYNVHVEEIINAIDD